MAIHLSVNFLVHLEHFKTKISFLPFPWQRQPFWNFQSHKSHLYLPVNNYIKFHKVQSILKIFNIFAVSMATVVFLEIPTSKVSSRLTNLQSYKVSLILEHFEIFDICDGSYGNIDHSQNIMAYTTLVHGRDHTIKVSINLTYHFKKVNATLRFLDHFDLFCIVSMVTADIF